MPKLDVDLTGKLRHRTATLQSGQTADPGTAAKYYIGDSGVGSGIDGQQIPDLLDPRGIAGNLTGQLPGFL
jgi:hypothetical protein